MWQRKMLTNLQLYRDSHCLLLVGDAGLTTGRMFFLPGETDRCFLTCTLSIFFFFKILLTCFLSLPWQQLPNLLKASSSSSSQSRSGSPSRVKLVFLADFGDSCNVSRRIGIVGGAGTGSSKTASANVRLVVFLGGFGSVS